MNVDEPHEIVAIQPLRIYNIGYFNLIDSCIEHLEH